MRLSCQVIRLVTKTAEALLSAGKKGKLASNEALPGAGSRVNVTAFLKSHLKGGMGQEYLEVPYTDPQISHGRPHCWLEPRLAGFLSFFFSFFHNS